MTGGTIKAGRKPWEIPGWWFETQNSVRLPINHQYALSVTYETRCFTLRPGANMVVVLEHDSAAKFEHINEQGLNCTAEGVTSQ